MLDIDSVGIDNNSYSHHFLSVFPDSFPVFSTQFTRNRPRDRFYQGIHHPSPVRSRFVSQDMTCDGLADPMVQPGDRGWIVPNPYILLHKFVKSLPELDGPKLSLTERPKTRDFLAGR